MEAAPPPAGERSRIVRNVTSSYGVRSVAVLSALLLTPYLYRSLGPAGFGTWSVMFAFTTIFSLLESGFSAGLVRFVASYGAQGRRRELTAALGTGVTLLSLVGVAAFAFSVLAAAAFGGLAASEERWAFELGMVALGAAMLVRFPCTAYAAALKGQQRYDLSNTSLAITIVLQAVGSVAAIEAGAGVLGLAVAFAVSLAIGGLLYLLLLHRLDPSLSLRPRLRDRGAARRLSSFGSYTLLADSMVFVSQRMDVVFIAALRSATAAAPYAAAVKLQSGLQALTSPVEMLMPMVSDLWARGARIELIRRLTLVTRLMLQITLPVAVGIALFAEDVVDLWLGSTAPAVTASIVVVLMAVQSVTLTAFPAHKALIGMGRVRTIGVLSLVEGTANVALSVTLIVFYGALGAALGTLMTSAALAPVRFPLLCRALDWPLSRFLRESLGAAAVSSLPALAAMAVIWATIPPGPGRALGGPAAGILVAAAVGAWQLGLGRPGALRRVLAQLRGARVASSSQQRSVVPAESGRWPR